MPEKQAREASKEASDKLGERKTKLSKAKLRQKREKRKAERLASKEEAKERAREMLRSSMGVSEVIEKTGLPGKTVGGLQTYLIKEEKVKRLLREGKSIEEIKEDAKIPKPIIRSIAKAEHLKPLEQPKVSEVMPEEDENMLSVRLDDEERELFEKGKTTMLAFQDAGIIPKKLRNDSDAEFMRLASLSLASAMTAVQEQTRGGK